MPNSDSTLSENEIIINNNNNNNYNDNHEANNNHGKKKQTPLPWLQVSIVYLIQFAEPITGTVILPFINQFVRETGITGGDERKTGYFAGLIESAFFFAEAAVVVFWGMASDRFGRRPVLLLGPFGLGFAMLAFGMSTKFQYLLLFRCLQGTFNGNIGVTKSVIGEITDETNMARAFALIGVVWSVGATIGPILGGFLSRPSVRWPDTIGKVTYLRNHPYFLPCFVSALGAFVIFLISFLALKETLPSAILRNEEKRRRKLSERQSSCSTISSSSTLLATDDEPRYYGSTGLDTPPLSDTENNLILKKYDQVDLKPPSFRTLITRRECQVALINHGFLAFTDMSVQVLMPLMWSTSIEYGGLNFTPYMIGLTMGIWGFINAFLQIFFIGLVINRFGPRRVHIFCYSLYLLSLTGFPITGYLAKQAGGADWKVWCVIAVQLSIQTTIYGAYGSMQLIITGSVPTKAALGTMNGMAQAVGCCMRSLAPSFASSLYSITLQHGLAGGNAVYYILMAVVLCGIRFTLMLPRTLRLP